MATPCPNSGCDFSGKSLGAHWALSESCDFPPIPPTIFEKMVGILMGDGSVGEGDPDQNPRWEVSMINKTFIEWLDQKLGWMTTGVHTSKPSETGYTSKNMRYTLVSRRHPSLWGLRSWYDSGKKRYPDELDLTPEILRMWYVSDGWQDNRGDICLGCLNESDRPDFISDLFLEHRIDIGWSESGVIRIKSQSLPTFFDFIGPAPPGFAQKWPA